MKKEKMAVVAGFGDLPLKIIKQLQKDKKEFIVLALKPFVNFDDYAKFETYPVQVGQFKRAFSIMKKCNIKTAVLAGAVKRPSILDLKLDSLSYKILLKATLKGFGDDSLLRSVMHEFEKRDIKVLGASEVCPHLHIEKGVLTKKKLTKKEETNIKKGIDVLKKIGDLDIGQAVIVDQGTIIGVEAIEGTKELIKRCGKHKLSKNGGVLVKMKKPNQSEKVDMPTIGRQTIEDIYVNGFAGIAIEGDSVIVVDKEEVIKTANEYKIFIKVF